MFRTLNPLDSTCSSLDLEFSDPKDQGLGLDIVHQQLMCLNLGLGLG